MIEFVDRNQNDDGTPLDRSHLMAVQGFDTSTTKFDGNTVTANNKYGEVMTTTFNSDGTITKTLVGEKTISMTISFSEDGSVVKTLN